jgi:hypothetical protein
MLLVVGVAAVSGAGEKTLLLEVIALPARTGSTM